MYWQAALENIGDAGTIPSGIGHLPNLRLLDLNTNQLSGTLDGLAVAVAESDSVLRYLNLADNELSGDCGTLVLLPHAPSRCSRPSQPYSFLPNILQTCRAVPGPLVPSPENANLGQCCHKRTPDLN